MDANISKGPSSYDVNLTVFDAAGKPVETPGQAAPVTLKVVIANGGLNLTFTLGDQLVLQGRVAPSTTRITSGDLLHVINLDDGTAVIRFADSVDSSRFSTLLKREVATTSAFDQRTEEASAKQYFQFYGYLCQQQNMMQDFTRTSTYQAAILQNGSDFLGKVVLDVGAGSAILSFFAAQAGARKVYAIEASSVASHAKLMVEKNNMSHIIEVIQGQIEEVHIPEEVDIIISEPMGYMLFNERMLETFLHAKKWLKPTGRVFPTQGDLYCSPFMDDLLSMEQTNKANFWSMTSFHGVDLSSLRSAAADEYARQPVVDTFDLRILLARPNRHTVDFAKADEKDLHRIHFPVNFQVTSPGTVHGLAFWFDVAFIGSTTTIWLSTSPHEPLTHWYQVRCLLRTPLLVRAGQSLSGFVTLVANARQSYDVTIDLGVDGTSQHSSNCLDLKNPYFRYSGMAPQAPPAASSMSPTEAYFSQAGASTGSMALAGGHPGEIPGAAAAEACMNYHHHSSGSVPTAHDHSHAMATNAAPTPSYGSVPVGNSNGSMSARIASAMPTAASYAAQPDHQPRHQQQQQQPISTLGQVHPSLATRFGLANVASLTTGMATSSVSAASTALPGAYVPQYTGAGQGVVYSTGSSMSFQPQPQQDPR